MTGWAAKESKELCDLREYPWCCASACVSLPPSSGFGETSPRDKAAFASVPRRDEWPFWTAVASAARHRFRNARWFPANPNDFRPPESAVAAPALPAHSTTPRVIRVNESVRIRVHSWLKEFAPAAFSIKLRSWQIRSSIGLKPRGIGRRGCFWRCSSRRRS